ncbi:hypothetical protein E5K00_08185 [Hymenobacter aquaticus]|uniref:Lipoprotein n=1 Tax=Hymenobacter aquaticus TaxID=1867101 RepID=A0A4Z0Q7N0_9BACT|nr:hypothetical protein [Hymenobacter aquaticus]TGE25163.1 hypothetical protein E5K00_08185 [Hymenobacter aquaticus]
MKKNLLRWYFALGLSGLTACQEAPTTQQHCYAHYSDEDTISLSLRITSSAVTGYIRYNAGPDRNQGRIQGQMHGDTLLASYRLEINGQLSQTAAPVAFLRQSNGFVEGFGDIKESEGLFTFKTREAIWFDPNRVLTPVVCSEVAAPSQQ